MRTLPCSAHNRRSRGAMKPYTGYTARIGFHCSSLRRIQSGLIALLLCLPFAASPANATAPAMATGARVYLLRGLMNIFSLGLDDIATKLQAQGIPVTVANFASWSSLAEEAVAEYRSGRVRNIILGGPSDDATILPDIVDCWSELRVPR